VDPGFSSNYYRATKIYCNSNDEVWGMIYGEIFMNLERNSSRTAEISKLLFDTNKNQIKFMSDSSATVSFCQAMIMVNDTKKIAIPFCLIYEPTLLMSILSEKNVTISSLDRIRKNFVENYFNMKRDQSHPNILFEYQKKMLAEGQLEAYNYWIMMKGDEDEFTAWHSANGTKWDSFVKWFTANPLKLNGGSKFYRAQY
jgi:hypothetical protein